MAEHSPAENEGGMVSLMSKLEALEKRISALSAEELAVFGGGLLSLMPRHGTAKSSETQRQENSMPSPMKPLATTSAANPPNFEALRFPEVLALLPEPEPRNPALGG